MRDRLNAPQPPEYHAAGHLRTRYQLMTTQFLERPGGRISYDDSGGDGPLILAAPGMGDSRKVYRHLAPALTGAGLRLATMDLRGIIR